MLRHKKLLALILGGVMTTSVMLTGCGSSDKKAEGGAASEEPVNLVWYVKMCIRDSLYRKRVFELLEELNKNK